LANHIEAIHAVTDRRILIQGPKLDSATMERVSREVFELNKTTGDILVVFDSPGGRHIDGKTLFDVFRTSREKVIGMVQGIADSAAFIALLGCHVKLATHYSTFVVHNSEMTYEGRIKYTSSAKEYLKTFKRVNLLRRERIWLISLILKKTKGKISRRELSKLLDEDRRIDADEAIKLGFIDGIV